jgi:transcriptional regulator with XRE-family HTH domain
MKFGDYIRLRREQKSWTQPEAAAKADIEQSYLSKLETGKSYPSEDIFNRLVDVLGIDTSDMSRQVFSAELDKLREIKEVRAVVLERQKSESKFLRIWLAAGLVLLMIGGACLGLVLLSHQNDIQQFQYRSTGVLRTGESLDAFDVIKRNVREFADINPKFKSLLERQQGMIERIDENDIISIKYRGESFINTVPDGKRFYRLIDSREIEQVSNLRWFLAPALMFLMGGFGCFFISRKWR